MSERKTSSTPTAEQTPSSAASAPEAASPPVDSQPKSQTGMASSSGGKRTPEDAATNWPPVEYREWVQSQVANKMFLRLSAIGIGTLIVFGSAYFTLQNYVLGTQTQEIVASVVEEVKPIVNTAVLEQLLRQSELVKNASDAALKQLEGNLPQIVKGKEFRESTKKTIQDEVETLVGGEDFRKTLFALVTSQLEGEGTVERAIMNQAFERATDPDEADATRALGLQLFTLLYDSVRKRDPSTQGLRETFVSVVNEAKLDPLPRLLNTVVLEYYPIGERAVHTDGECQNRVNCENWDRDVIDYVLRALSSEKFDQDWVQFENFFRRLSEADLHRVAQWSLDNWKLPLAKRTLLAILGTSSTKNSIVLRLIVKSNEQQVNIRAPLLVALNSIASDTVLSAELRVKLLKILWRVTDKSERKNAFNFEPADAGELPDAAIQIRMAALNILRTAENAEWDYVFRTAFGGSPDVEALSAWVMRMEIDANSGKDVSRAAAWLLPTEFKSADGIISKIHEPIYARALKMIESSSFDEFAKGYINAVSGDAKRASRELTVAIVRRLALEDQIGGWLDEHLAPDLHSHEFQIFLLSAINAQHDSNIVSKNADRDVLHKALTLEGDGFSRKHQIEIQHAILPLLASKFTDRKLSSDVIFDVIFAIEESGVLGIVDGATSTQKTQEAVLELRKWLDWIDNPLPADTSILMLVDNFSEPIKGGTRQTRGDIWFEAHVEELLNLVLEGAPAGTEIVVFDRERKSTVKRALVSDSGVPAGIQLTPGDYAIAFRRPDNTVAFTLEAFKGSKIVEAKSGEPLILNTAHDYRVLIDTKDSGATTELQFPLETGMFFIAETSEGANGNGADTYLTLVDVSTGDVLEWDDDGANNGYSRLTYVADATRTTMLIVSNCCDAASELPSETSIEIELSFTSQENATFAAREIEDAPILRPGNQVKLIVSDRNSWIRIELPEAGFYQLQNELGLAIEELRTSKGTAIAISPHGPEGEPAILASGPVVADLQFSVATAGIGMFNILQGVEVARAPGAVEIPLGSGIDVTQPTLLALPLVGAQLMLDPAYFSEVVNITFFDPDPDNRPVLKVMREIDGQKTEITQLAEREFDKHRTLSWLPEEGASDTLVVSSTKGGTRSTLIVNYAVAGFAYEGFENGDLVVLGRHVAFNGNENWDESMQKYVGCIAQIEELKGSESNGLFFVTVNLNYEEEDKDWVWRTRNLLRAPPEMAQPEHCLQYEQ